MGFFALKSGGGGGEAAVCEHVVVGVGGGVGAVVRAPKAVGCGRPEIRGNFNT